MDIKKKRTTVAYKLTDSNLASRIAALREKYGIDLLPSGGSSQAQYLPLLKITKHQLIIEHQGSNLFFHPSMALLRMISLLRGEEDRFLEATGLKAGDTFVDATMGLATDSLIAAWAVGPHGKVLALEGSPLLHLLVSEGLAAFEQLPEFRKNVTERRKHSLKAKAWLELAEAAGRIELFCTDHFAYLQTLADNSVDVVYFDPMFRDSLAESSPSIKPLKELSLPEALSLEAVQEAWRVARRRVVLKERKGSGEFERLGFKLEHGGKYSNICFGVIETGEGKD